MNNGSSTASRSRGRSSRSSRRSRAHAHPSTNVSPATARWGVVGVTLLALALGGATELWEQALVISLGALVMLVAPPRRSRGIVPLLISTALLLIALSAFLPAAWFPVPEWRQRLADNPQIVLPGTRTPQPWLTLQACAFLFIGLAWAGYVLSQAWDRSTRLRAARGLVAGVGLLAAIMTAAFCFDFQVPNWTQVENRGWFPNRNQTADVLAVCGLLSYALLFGALRKKQVTAVVWGACLLSIAAALIVAYSRAGILMFFGGIALWHLWPVQGATKRPGSLKWAMLGLVFVFVLLTGFFLAGGDTLARFEGQKIADDSSDFRISIQEDALRFSRMEPLLGIGLGNFAPLFAPEQRASAIASRAIHPESDWLWAACEMGWLAPLLFVAAIVWWLRRCLPFRDKPGEALRRAATMAAILFVLHGLVDVSGHRLGSVWVGLLLASLALPRPSTLTTALPPAHRYQPWLFRLLALAMLGITGWWFASVEGAAVPPTTADLARIEPGIRDALAARDPATALALANTALLIAPVDWQLHFERGYAGAFLPAHLRQAGEDFMAARQLEGRWVKPCFDEGTAWLQANEADLCLDAWQEALHRAGADEKPQVYKDMMELGQKNPTVRAGLLDLAANQLDLQLVFLDYATPDETKQVTTAVLATDSELASLSEDQRARFLRQWWDHGSHDDLLAAINAHPGWADAAWPLLAESFAEKSAFQQAWELVARFETPPVVPDPQMDLPRVDLERSFHDGTDNTAAGVMLYLQQDRQGDLDGAIGTLRALEQMKDCPRYVYYEEAKLWAQKQQWELAWTAWQNYHKT